jgi:hypothetical protein
VITEPWLLTSRYAEPAVAQFDGAKVRVTVGFPRFRLRYKLDAAIRELAPFGLTKLTGIQFERAYRQHLDQLGVDHVLELLEATRSLTPSRKSVILCFEPIGRPCHRRQLAAWLEERAGLVVPELGSISTPLLKEKN